MDNEALIIIFLAIIGFGMKFLYNGAHRKKFEKSFYDTEIGKKSKDELEVFFIDSVKRCDVGAVARCIVEGVNVNCIDEDCMTALMYARRGINNGLNWTALGNITQAETNDKYERIIKLLKDSGAVL